MPSKLKREEIESTAAAMFPAASKDDVRAMAVQTLAAGNGSLHFLENIRRIVEYVARRNGRTEITGADVKQALTGYATPVTRYARERIAATTQNTTTARARKKILEMSLARNAPRQCGQRSVFTSNVCAQCLQCFIEWAECYPQAQRRQ
ncbi:MAG TPA: hypothetical protein VK530_16780 [Candidatus Acidoferrum sp.]|nr:hypothetical protein [Candidatus Acidoferrum sp.]